MEQNEKDIDRYGQMKSSRIWSGLILVAAGALLLASKMGAPIPSWVLTWPVFLIGLGLLTGVKSRFHNPGALIMIIVGGIFLIDNMNPELHFHNYIVPTILICVGLLFMLRPKRNWKDMSKTDWRRYVNNPAPVHSAPSSNTEAGNKQNDTKEDSAEHVEINTAFGSVKKIILSKNFKGGEINNFMGGTELNLMKADMQKTVELEVNNVFGGTKLIVPSNWNIKNEVTAVFGGIEDKRTIGGDVGDATKIMVLKGTCVFGGIEITNY